MSGATKLAAELLIDEYRALFYSRFGGLRKQVCGILHVDDLFALPRLQAADRTRMDGATFNDKLGGAVSVPSCKSKAQWSALTGRWLEIGQDLEMRPADIPWHVSDCRPVTEATGWRPQRNVVAILHDVRQWLVAERVQLEPILGA